MAFEMKVWEIQSENLIDLEKSNLELEKRLEQWISEDVSITGLDIFIIGRQVRTEYGGIIDLLGMNQDGDLVIIELKRDKTSRDIIAQILDYATWVQDIDYDMANSMCISYNGKDLSDMYHDTYEDSLPDKINTNHQMVIVASELDDATERIVQYLYNQYHININAIFFNVFKTDTYQLLSRSWINDPEDVEMDGKKKSPPWSGYLYVNTGIDPNNDRFWKNNIKYNYISAGGGPRWIKAIRKLRKNDKIFAYIKGGVGYVGYGIVEEEAVPVKDYIVDGQSILKLLPEASILVSIENSRFVQT